MTADDLRDVLGEVGRVARVDALGRKRQKEVLFDLQTRRFEHGQGHLVGRARIGGRFEYDQLTACQVRRDNLERLNDKRQIRILRLA